MQATVHAVTESDTTERLHFTYLILTIKSDMVRISIFLHIRKLRLLEAK